MAGWALWQNPPEMGEGCFPRIRNQLLGCVILVNIVQNYEISYKNMTRGETREQSLFHKISTHNAC